MSELKKNNPLYSLNAKSRKPRKPSGIINVLDTSILLNNAEAIYAYPNEEVIIPLSVIEELDGFKRQVNHVGRQARAVITFLDSVKHQISSAQGAELTNKTNLKIWTELKTHSTVPEFSDMHKNSNRVLSAAVAIRAKHSNSQIKLITNDMNLRIKAAALNIESESYREDVNSSSQIYEPLTQISLTKDDVQSINEFDHLQLKNTDHGYYPNQQILVNNNLLCRYIQRSNYLKKVQIPDSVWNIQSRNLEQTAALDLLLDKNIDIVILAGKAGTGKTLLALAAALELVFHTDNNLKILVSRPIVPLGKDIGFLPGDIEEKIYPWMQPIFDNLEFLGTRQSKKGMKLVSIQQLIEKKLIEIEALTYIRGRSIPNRFMIVDEAQNLTPHEVKTIITRVGDNTKLVLTGDPFQIDNPYVDLATNGLSYAIEKLKPFDIAAHANLVKGERSKLAELAANIL